jgi:hypothetical protein
VKPLSFRVSLVPVLLVLACAGTKPAPSTGGEGNPPAPTTAEPEAQVADTTCTSSYTVKALISGRELQEMIDGTIITDSSPFTCKLATSSARADFKFVTTVENDSCTYDMSYVNDATGNAFSGTQTMSCSNLELDFSATATPRSSIPACDGKPTLSDDPKIKLNDHNCGGGVE